ncbi:LLM class flavin-dependent oxidoreductase [Dactylosporangium roseum]|uniref:LLM class flavin-dependent oxidoreductase n=1 Tax=Dactylosporangium roseum TaxID=47989 RepID=A0ABY5ZBH8_9ACTN|nr:LLM class flavin-dependent oxidoreductase [Dactylosporangium roseum]UWZ39386.1 LLM class flavin-dependent oxidoreductase [Dactylosporangium roseum]
MRLGVNLVHEGAGELAQEAERLGFELALAAEGYQSDAPSVLGLVAGQTSRIGLASGVMQIPARQPGAAALTAATLDALSGGRFRLGLGVSNPHVSDGWYGVRFDHPLERTREYVEVVRRALSGNPVRYAGKHFALPAWGHENAPLRLLTHPVDRELPIYLGAVGPRSIQLTGEIADGWLCGFTTPAALTRSRAELLTGRRRRGKDLTGFEVVLFAAMAVGDNAGAAADSLRAHYARLLGIGGPKDNFYCRLATEMGYEKDILEFRNHLLAGDLRGSAAAVPAGFIDRTALIGPVERIADRMREYAEAGVTVLSIMVSANHTDLAGRLEILRQAAKAAEMAEC